MPDVLTEASIIQCSHAAPVVLLAMGTPKLTVLGANVLVASGASEWTIPACAVPTPCVKVLSVASRATKLFVGGSAVVVAPLPGMPAFAQTEGGSPITPAGVTAGQRKLSAL